MDFDRSTYQHRYEIGDGDPSVALVSAVADVEDRSPTDLPSLSERVDPDSLDAAVRSMNEGTVSVTYCGYSIAVLASGEILVREAD